jgi:hypothetical protein
VVAFFFYDAHEKMITIISIMLMRKMGMLHLVIVAFAKMVKEEKNMMHDEIRVWFLLLFFLFFLKIL